MSEATVRRYLSLLRLPEALREKVGTARGAAGVGVMAELAQRFADPEDMATAYSKIQGFTADVGQRILRRSEGDVGSLDDLVDRAIAGEFNRFQCGSSLETCPYVPENVRPTIRGVVESLASRN